MSRISSAVALVAAAAAMPALAASPFDGTWKSDIRETRLSQKPHTILLANGTYSCDCTPPIRVKADGVFHTVTNQPYFDELAVEVIDDHRVSNEARKNGRSLGTQIEVLSADGQTLTTSTTDTSAPNGTVTRSVALSKRVAPAPAGAHPLSGGWVATATQSASEADLIETLSIADEVLHVRTPTGFDYDAPLDGTPVPIKGDPAGTMASVKMTGPRTLVENDSIGGKPMATYTMTVRPDGRTMDIVREGRLSGRVTRFVSHKQ